MPNSTNAALPNERHRSVVETMSLAVASAASFALSLGRTKIQALLWGPLGVGSLGLMQASMSTASIVGGFGVEGLVTRELAAASSDEERTRVISLAVRGMALVALASAVLSSFVFAALSSRLGFTGWLDAGIVGGAAGAAVLSGNLRGIVSGSHRVSALGRSMVIASFAATIAAAALALFSTGPVAFACAVLILPTTQLAALFLASRGLITSSLLGWKASLRQALRACVEARSLAIAGILPVFGQLLIRTTAREALSVDSFGAFQASMTLAATSVSVLASSVGPSVLPRLSASVSDPARMKRVLNESIDTYLLFYAPVVMAIVALPELAVRVLFSSRFEGVVDQLPWQLVGEVLRLPCWVMATFLTASGRFRGYLMVEATSLVAMVAAVAISARSGRLELVGIALAAATAIQFVVLALMLRASHVSLESQTLFRIGALLGCCVLAALLVRSHIGFRVAAVVTAAVWAGAALRRVSSLRKT